MGRSRLRIGLTQRGSDEGGSTSRTSKQIEDYHRSKRTFQYKKNDRGKIIKIPMLTGGQAKLDKNKNNKLDAQDFKILRAEKAKGRGQGLQDEKMKPGKPMKAVIGALALGAAGAMGLKKVRDKFKKKAKATPGMGAIRTGATGMGGMAAGLVSKKMKELGLEKTSLMGGGMMMRTPGYKKGKSVMAKGCKLGRKKPTKMY